MSRLLRHIASVRSALLIAAAIVACASPASFADPADDAADHGSHARIEAPIGFLAGEAVREASRPMPDVTQREARDTNGFFRLAPGKKDRLRAGLYAATGGHEDAPAIHPPLYCLHDSYLI